MVRLATYFGLAGLFAVMGSICAQAESSYFYEDMVDKAFVLKHPSGQRPAVFVRTSDSDRLTDLMQIEGYELVVRRTESGLTPVLGDVLPAHVAEAEGERVRDLSSDLPKDEPRTFTDMIDVGVGLNLGITTGGKARILGTFENGATVGIDLDAGTIIFITEATFSAILGWQFQVDDHQLRPYLTVGAGNATIWAILAVASADVYNAGVGFEWKPARWFGLGLEGGAKLVDYENEENDRDSVVVPWARLNVMFYFI